MHKKLVGLTGLIIVAVLLLSVNMISNVALRGKKLDMTENKLYTLTDGTRNILKSLQEPITLRFYFSEKLMNNEPVIMDHGKRVREMLEEYQQIAGGKLMLEIYDPEPFSDAEEKAVRAGIQGLPISQTENMYFGMEGVNSTDGRQVIPFFSPEPDKAQFLEYDVTSLIYNLAHPEKRKLTIVTSLPIDGSGNAMARMMGQQDGGDPWYIYTQLQQLYDVTKVEATATKLPEKTDVLVVIHPKDASAEMKYAIDNYVLHGGRAIIYVDPLAESDKGTPNPNNPMQAMMQPKASDLPESFKQWGIELEEGKILADRANAIQVNGGSQNRPEIVDFVLYQSLKDDSINKTEYATSQLKSINVGMTGVFKKLDGAKTEITPILQSSEDTQLLDASAGQMFPQPGKLLSDFKPDSDHKRRIIAARITGKVSAAFPDGPKGGTKAANHLTESEVPIDVVVVADTDMLADRFWVQVQKFFGQQMASKISNNADMLVNFIDFYGGSKDLISIRGREGFQRPFKLIEEMEKDAGKRSEAKMKELEDKLKEAETKLQELQTQKPAEGSSRLTLSSEQQAEIEKFRVEQIKTSRELRQQQHSLRDDVEKLVTKLKFINIALIPLLVGIFAVILGMLKGRRRRK
ncbi:Gldg family protein [Candidatus Sumerlaeota bacterium]|nr:Gldg family protein [Candidatus Sumerlaeota bacterium]